MFGNQFGGATGYNEMVNARAQQRLQNATGMFGFGNTLAGTDLTRMGSAMGGYTGVHDAIQGQAKFGADMGAQGMAGGVQPAQPSPFGGFLQGLGGAVSGMDLGSMFGGGYNPSAARNAPYSAPVQGALSQPYTPTFGMSNYAMPSIRG
jgi:hypothetical protein